MKYSFDVLPQYTVRPEEAFKALQSSLKRLTGATVVVGSPLLAWPASVRIGGTPMGRQISIRFERDWEDDVCRAGLVPTVDSKAYEENMKAEAEYLLTISRQIAHDAHSFLVELQSFASRLSEAGDANSAETLNNLQSDITCFEWIMAGLDPRRLDGGELATRFFPPLGALPIATDMDGEFAALVGRDVRIGLVGTNGEIDGRLYAASSDLDSVVMVMKSGRRRVLRSSAIAWIEEMHDDAA